MDKQYTKSIDFNGEKLTFKLGGLAPRADSTVWAQVGETVVLAIVTIGRENPNLDYFPLSIEYIEKFYAGGRISGSRFQKRERWPSDDAVLKARQIDHSIRSLFPKGYKKEVSLTITVLAYDNVHDPETLAVTAGSLAMLNSNVPFMGPAASVVVGVQKGELILNPSNVTETEEFDSEFIISARNDKRILNVEGYGDEFPEEKMFELLDFALDSMKPLLEVQEEIVKELGKTRPEFIDLSPDKEVLSAIETDYASMIKGALADKDNRDTLMQKIKDELAQKYAGDDKWNSSIIADALDYLAKTYVRKDILESDKRTSGRKLDEIRPLTIEVGVLPRVHGSAIFQRGLTQCLSVVTLGSTRLVQQLESYEGEDAKRWMHHYNGPNYSLGQAGRFNYIPGRREVGHGNIGENALLKMIPPVDKFPYTLRVVSEILSQQGSSSMAATCGTTLALMDAGVAIKAPVGGVSVGLVTDKDEKEFKFLVDIEDVEDFYGDMDFKVTGTTQGITAIQLDNKLRGIPVEILKKAIEKSKEGRLHILKAMSEVIAKPREQLSTYAPKVDIIKIRQEKIGELIGPGGKVIKGIIDRVGGDVEIDIQDDGTVTITSLNEEQRKKAKVMVEDIVVEPEIGKIYEGKVASVKEYGAFVDVTPNISGLVHKSEMSDKFVTNPEDFVKEGQMVKVKVLKLENGRISFTMKGLEQENK
jgi:polyribonucleotide nucleotidyltransferase